MAFILSLQGLSAKHSKDLVWIDPGEAWFDWMNLMESEYGISPILVNADVQHPVTKLQEGILLAQRLTTSYNGYILCDLTVNPESLYVALSLAGPLNLLVVDISIEKRITNALDIPQLLDVRMRDLQWLLDNHHDKFSPEGLAYPNKYERISSADWCISRNWPIFFTEDIKTAEAFMLAAAPDSRIISWHPPYEIPGAGAPEDRFISYYSEKGLNLVPGVLMWNMSTLSSIVSIDRNNPLNQNLPTSYPINENKHYVALFLNSGGNLGYLHSRYLKTNQKGLRSNWMNQQHDFPVSFSMSLAAVDFSPLALRSIYNMKLDQDCFVTPFSGHSYIHPTKYKNLDHFCKNLDGYLTIADQDIVAIQENKLISIDERWVSQYGSKFFDNTSAKGLFVMNKPFGNIFWHSNKPVITKRFGMRIGSNPDLVAKLANNLNNQKPDNFSSSGYSIIHVDLEQTSFEDMQNLVRKLESHIQVVNLDELFFHVTNNVPH